MKERANDIATLMPLATKLRTAAAQNPYTLVADLSVQTYQQRHLAKLLQRGLPSRREENWKYTDVSFLNQIDFVWPGLHSAETRLFDQRLAALVAKRSAANILLTFVNGHLMPQGSFLPAEGAVPSGVIVSNLQQALQTHSALIHRYLLTELDQVDAPLACLNSALLADGLFVYLPAGVALQLPIHFLSIATEQQPFMMQPRHVIVLENDAQVTLTEEYVAEQAAGYLNNVVTQVFLGSNAVFNYHKIQQEGKHAQHFASIFIEQKQHSVVNAGYFNIGGGFCRQDTRVALREKHASTTVKGFYSLSHDGQFTDHHLFIDHAAANTQSNLDFQGVLARQTRAVFNGKVLVRPEGKGVDAQQFNQNILLSPLAEVNTKPDLEIYADEVQCRHGATVGRLDEEALFYLNTRGIDQQMAMTMLLQAFMNKALSSVTLPWLIDYLQEQWTNNLGNLL